MKLGDLCEIRYNMPEADFYLYARGSEKNLGMPSKDSDNTEKKIGVKVKYEAKELLDPGYLYYLFMHLHNTQFWQSNGLVYGSLQLKNLRVEDIKNLSIG
jgi:hypothetical protein